MMGYEIPTESGAGVIAGYGKPYRVKIRRHIGLKVKPEAEQLEGKVFIFRDGWIADADELYAGEKILIPNDFDWPADAPTFIAAGDLEAV